MIDHCQGKLHCAYASARLDTHRIAADITVHKPRPTRRTAPTSADFPDASLNYMGFPILSLAPNAI